MNIYIIFSSITLLFVCLILYPLWKAEEITRKQKQIFSFVIVLFFLGGGILLYSKFGTPEILPLIAEREEKLEQLREKITANSEAVKKNPRNIKAWIELGDSFSEASQFSAAANAYKQAVLLSEGNPEFIMSYARSLILAADGAVTDEAKKSLDMAIMLQPKNEEARYYLAIKKLQDGNSKEAMAEMKNLYKSLKNDSPLKAMIDKQIGRAN